MSRQNLDKLKTNQQAPKSSHNSSGNKTKHKHPPCLKTPTRRERSHSGSHHCEGGSPSGAGKSTTSSLKTNKNQNNASHAVLNQRRRSSPPSVQPSPSHIPQTTCVKCHACDLTRTRQGEAQPGTIHAFLPESITL